MKKEHRNLREIENRTSWLYMSHLWNKIALFPATQRVKFFDNVKVNGMWRRDCDSDVTPINARLSCNPRTSQASHPAIGWVSPQRTIRYVNLLTNGITSLFPKVVLAFSEVLSSELWLVLFLKSYLIGLAIPVHRSLLPCLLSDSYLCSL